MPRELPQLLVDEGVIGPGGVERALARQREAGGALDTALLELGLVAEDRLVGLLSRASDLPPAPLSAYEAVDARARRVFPSKVAERHGLAPFALDGRELSLVATHPLDLGLLDEISFMLSLHLTPHVGPEWRVRSLIQRLYGGPLPPRLARLAEAAGGPVPAVAEAPVGSGEAEAGEAPPEPARAAPTASPAVRAPPVRPIGFTGFSRAGDEPLEPLAAALAQAAEAFELDWEAEALAAPLPSAPRAAAAEPGLAPTARHDAPPAGAAPAATPAGPPPADQPAEAVTAPPEPSPVRPLDRSAPPHWTVAAARGVLAEAVTRDEVVLATLRYARDFFQYVALFAVTRDAVAGHDALGTEEGAREVARTVALYVTDPGIFRTTLDTLAPYLGPVARDASGSAAVLDGLGRGTPRTALVYPVLLRGRPICILYADNGVAPVSARRLGDLLLLLSMVGAAFERIIRARKDVGRPAPAAVAAQAAGEAAGRAEEPAPYAEESAGYPEESAAYSEEAAASHVAEPGPHLEEPGRQAEEPAPAVAPGSDAAAAWSVEAGAPELAAEVEPRPPARVAALDAEPQAEALSDPTPLPPELPPAPEPIAERPTEQALEPWTEPAAVPGSEPPLESASGPGPGLPAVPPLPDLADVEAAFFASAPGQLPEALPAPLPPPAGPPPRLAEPEALRDEVSISLELTLDHPLQASPGGPPPSSTPAAAPPPPELAEVSPELPRTGAGSLAAAPPSDPSSLEITLERPLKPAPPAAPLDAAALVGAYLVCPRGGDERAYLLGKLVERAVEVAPILCEQLPGPLDVPLEALGTTPAPGQGPVFAAVAALGPAAARPLHAMLADPDPARRRAAAALLGQLGDPSSFLPLAERCFDHDAGVAEAARSALGLHRRDPGMKAVPEKLRRALLSGLADKAARAARAIAALRDAESIPLLIQALEGSDAGTAAASADALAAITLQRHGVQARQWLMWWKQNRGRSRTEWLFGALTSGDRELRLLAATELRGAAATPVPYSADLPEAERQAAAQAWQRWFTQGGHRL